MKRYLDLAVIQAKRNKKQNRMTKICIFLSVFLIMGLFGMADMEIRSQEIRAIQKDGSWHAVWKGLSDDQAAILAARPEVETSARYLVKNYQLDEGWQIEGTRTVICGFDESLTDMLPAAKITEGSFPKGERDIACSDSIRTRLNRSVGDEITVFSPEGEPMVFTIRGFFQTTSLLTETDAFGVVVNLETCRNVFFHEEPAGADSAVYVQFVPFCRIQSAIRAICEQMGLSADQVGQNAMLLGLRFQSNDSYLMQIYLVVAVIAALVAIAGILMIAGSLNSSVAQRTEFFGLMRCLGATPGQVAKFVRKEALGWCRTAVPAALLAGTVTICGLCALLRYISPGFFGDLPVFGVSWIGIVSGAGIGIAAVLLAARAPAKKASGVSPLTAVSGNAGTVHAVKDAADTRRLPVEAALGIHHAKGSRKNLFLMSGSFAFGIILFLSFCTLHAFMDHALTPLRPEAPDLSIISQADAGLIPPEAAEKLAAHPAVRKVYGRSSAEGAAEEWTKEKDYAIIDLQLRRGTAEEEVEELRVLAGGGVTVSDKRRSNMEVMATYYAFLLFLYGFLALILMISAFHIINSMSMSVSARMKQYRTLYAIGMSRAQLLNMVAAEAGTYLFFGVLTGVPAGLALHRFLYRLLVESRWGDPWTVPVAELLSVLAIVAAATLLSLSGPAKRLRTME